MPKDISTRFFEGNIEIKLSKQEVKENGSLYSPSTATT